MLRPTYRKGAIVCSEERWREYCSLKTETDLKEYFIDRKVEYKLPPFHLVEVFEEKALYNNLQNQEMTIARISPDKDLWIDVEELLSPEDAELKL